MSNMDFNDTYSDFEIVLLNYPGGGNYTTLVTWQELRVIVVPIPEENINIWFVHSKSSTNKVLPSICLLSR